MVFLRSETRVCGNATFANFNLNIKFSYIIISKDVSRLMIVLGSKINEKSIWVEYDYISPMYFNFCTFFQLNIQDIETEGTTSESNASGGAHNIETLANAYANSDIQRMVQVRIQQTMKMVLISDNDLYFLK